MTKWHTLDVRGRPYSVRYRNRMLAVASWLDRCAAAIRAHVLRHTPERRLKAAMVVNRAMRQIGSGG